VRHPADGGDPLPRVRTRHRRGRQCGACGDRDAGARARRVGRTHHGNGRRTQPAWAATAEHPGRAARRGRARSRGPARARAGARGGDPARRGASGRRNRAGPRPRAGGSGLSCRRAAAARGRASQRRGGGRGARGGDGGHPAPRGPRSRSALVRGRGRGRHGRRVVAMSSLPSPTRARPRLVRSLLRLFTVQGSWNYERMQGIGIGVALGLGLPAILGFVVVYNVGHVALRWWALRAGWTYGARVAQALREPLLQRATALSGPAMALVIGAALPLVAQYLSGAFFGW